MAIQLQLRKGTKIQNDAFTGAEAELTYDSTSKTIRVHDGSTQGGVGFVDLVVDFQVPTAENNYTWYRKYRSGWVEQGGTWTGTWAVGNGTESTQNITLPVAMRDGEYHPLLNFFNMIWIFYGTQNLTTTGFTVSAGGYNNSRTINKFNWRVSGMAAN